MSRLTPYLLATCALAACQFGAPKEIDVDAPLPECEAQTATCSNDRLTECDTNGNYVRYQVQNGGGIGTPATLTMHEFPCPLGCADSTRCFDPVASHGLGPVIPRWPDVIPPDVDLETSNGSVVVVDTDTSATTLELADAAGHTFVVPVALISQPDGPEILTILVRSLTVRENMRIAVRGARAFAVVSAFDILVAGRLEARASYSAAGATSVGDCVGPSANTASGGGGNSDEGGLSSDSSKGRGLAQPTPQPVLVGGCGGGRINTFDGGAPGGAVQLVSRTRIAIDGVLSVAGGGGRAYASNLRAHGGANAASGGGSGGQVVLEAPVVQIGPSARIVGRGGSGAAARPVQGNRAIGVDGDYDLDAAIVPGATCVDCGIGGDGGTESSLAGWGSVGPTTFGLAGGGGSVGRATIATRTATLTPPTSAMLLKYSLTQIARE